MHLQPTRSAPQSALSRAEAASISDALALVAGWDDLSVTRRRDLASALKAAARMAGLPDVHLPLTPAALRQHVLCRSPAANGVSEGRMRNIRSALRYIMRRLDLIDPADAPLLPAWSALLHRLDEGPRAGLVGLARFCSTEEIAPEAVTAATLDALEVRLTARSLAPRPRKLAGEVRGTWNQACRTVSGWPGQFLPARQDPGQYVLPLEAFPQSFRDDLAAFGERLSDPLSDSIADTEDPRDETRPLPRVRKKLRPATVALRQSHCRWAASALVASGVAIDQVTDLASLVTPPERAKRILRFLWERAGARASAAGGHVTEVLCMVAREHVGLPKAQEDRIRSWGEESRLTYDGMTEKNERAVRAALNPARQARLLALPEGLLAAARELRGSAPRQAASLALRAVALELLLRRPLRLDNLIRLRLDRHLERSDPKRRIIDHLTIPAEETKNKRRLSLPVPPETARMLEEWITVFRPIVAAPECLYLFPGHGTGDRPMTPQGLRDAIKATLSEHVGVTLSPHQFRHLAARIYLQDYPGHYEAVRQLLGHASVETTLKHYSGIEGEACALRYDGVMDEKRGHRLPPAPVSRKGRNARRARGGH